MVVDDLDILSPIFPPEADTPLVVDPHRPSSTAIAAELLQAVPRRNTQIFDPFGRVQHVELSPRYRRVQPQSRQRRMTRGSSRAWWAVANF
jgi:hypothetical protein